MTGCFGEFDVASDGGFDDQFREGFPDLARDLLVEQGWGVHCQQNSIHSKTWIQKSPDFSDCTCQKS